MKATKLTSLSAKAVVVLFAGSVLMSSCSKGTSCPAYTGYKKHYKKTEVVVENVAELNK
jgi:hypothetical protein